MAETNVKIDIAGQLDPDQMLFVLCCEYALRFKPDSLMQFASNVETLIEVAENIGIQRVVLEGETS